MPRLAAPLLLLLVLAGLPTLGLADPGEAQRAHDRILRGLGLQPGALSAKERRGFHSRLAEPRRGSLVGATRELRARAFLPAAAVYVPKELATMAKMSIEDSFSPLSHPGLRPAGGADGQRAQAIYWRLGARLSRELGVKKSALGPLLVLEGGDADRPGASALANGSMVMNRGSITAADAAARAVLAGRSKREVMSNLLAVALERWPGDLEVDARQARRISDGFLAITVGHEMTHTLKGMIAAGKPRDVVESPFGAQSRTYRAQELIADAGGAELAMRGGFSPVGALAFFMYQSVLEAYTGSMIGPLAGTHPRSNERYRAAHRYITERAAKARQLYDGVHSPRRGPAYLAAEDRQALAQLPTPAELDEYLMGLPHGMRYLYPGSNPRD